MNFRLGRGRRAAGVRSALAEALEPRLQLSASLVKDINATSTQPPSYEMANLGDTVFYVAANREVGEELWKTDGSPEGTMLVKDIFPGPNNSRPRNLTVVGDTLFFTAAYDQNRYVLWKTDGTTQGTIIVKDIAGPDSHGDSRFYGLQEFKGKLLFYGFGGPNLHGVWISDGTTDGTRLVKSFENDIATYGPVDSSLTYHGAFAQSGDRVYFRAAAADELNPLDLWSTDGTPDGTRLVHSINSQFITRDPGPQQITAVGERIFYSQTYTEQRGIHVIDRDGSEPTLLADGAFGYDIFDVKGLAVFREGFETTHTVFESPVTQANAYSLWASDGTPQGTVKLGDFADTGGPEAGTATVIDGVYYFSAQNGSALWRTDGTPAGTKLVREWDGASGLSELTNANGRLVFRLSDVENGSELWISDGSAEGTRLLANVAPGAAGSEPRFPLFVGDLLYFQADDGGGDGIWNVDLTTGQLRLAGRKDATTRGSSPAKLMATSDAVYFTADDGIHGRELWKSDGSAQGTQLVVDLAPGADGADPTPVASVGNRLLFTSRSVVDGSKELWSTDGTADGTSKFDRFSALANRVVVGDTLYFYDDGLWKSDGTPQGTSLVKTFGGDTVLNLMKLGDAVFFVVRSNNVDTLWKSDGSEIGTTPVVQLSKSTLFSLDAADKLFLVLKGDKGERQQIWTSDGTEAGTHVAFRIFSAPFLAESMINPVVARSCLYYQNRDTLGKYALVQTDGSAEGTHGVFLNFDSLLYNPATLFPSDDGSLFVIHAKSVFKLDATSRVSLPGMATAGLGTYGGVFYFLCGLSGTGDELWRSDGTRAGTYLVADIAPGDHGALDHDAPSSLAGANGAAFFAANDGLVGNELWQTLATPIAPLAAVQTQSIFYNDSAFDGHDPAANENDENAVAPDKTALFLGQPTTFANVSSYTKGLNGLIIDVAPTRPDAVISFGFQYGSFPDEGFPEHITPSSVVRRPGTGANGSDRYHIIFSHGVTDAWLRVQVNASVPGVATPIETFYFGNLAGVADEGALTNGVLFGLIRVRNALGRPVVPDITSGFDFNRDGRFNIGDLVAARNHINRGLLPLGTRPVGSLVSNLSQDYISRRIDPPARRRMWELVDVPR